MRNLQLRKRYHLLQRKQDGLHPRITATAWDGESVIIAYGPSTESPLLELRRWNPVNSVNSDEPDDVTLITSFDAPCPLPDLESERILKLYYLPEKSAICLVLAGGDLVLVREDPLPGEEKIEIVGSVEVGLTAAEWSPDGELMVLTTRANTMLFMTRELENASSTTLTEDDLKASKHVSVGWGKKETQFTGRGAKALRDPTMPETVDEGVKSVFDDDSTTISWRGDGQYLAVNSRQASGRRVIRVYSREGVLDGVSEPVDNLEAALSWRPAGNLMASIQRVKEEVNVIFFERNGLRHGEFSLRPTPPLSGGPCPTSSMSLRWNCDSTILAVCFSDRIQLWTMGNYHYYLKQEIVTLTQEAPYISPALTWDPEHPLKYIMRVAGKAEVMQYASVVCKSPTQLTRSGTVAVIDGRILKVTALRYANVPPPIAQSELVVGGNIKDVSICQDGSEEVIAVLDATTCYIFGWRPREQKNLRQLAQISLSQAPEQDEISRVILRSCKSLELLGGTARRSQLFSYSCSNDDHNWQLTGTKGMSVVSDIVPIYGNKTAPDESGVDSQVLIICYGGCIFSFPRGGSDIEGPETPFQTKIRKDVEEVQVWRARDEDLKSGKDTSHIANRGLIALGMTQTGGLYANSRCLARDCTSFTVTPAHLLYTTSKHLLKFVHLTTVDELIIPGDTPEEDERCRSIERGARIVTIIPSIAAVVLQMPRGNLETIYPRALVLAEIRRHIDHKQYGKAFISCRKQRVDMNIIHDYKPDQFLSSVDLFVEQIQKVEHIDLFLSQLRDEDVSVSMYKDTLTRNEAEKIEAKANSNIRATGKVNKICDVFLPVLRSKVSTNLQNIITAHVCKNPPDIEAGLLEVAKLYQRNEGDGERAVEHICFLVDVNRLYDNALGLYDLELTLLIAQQSQKDPREYLPFLQRLHDLPEEQRKFSIDDHLNRYKKALGDLWEVNDFDKYKAYVVKHSLYEDACVACRYDEAKYQDIMRLYAVYLSQVTRHKEAGIAFEYLHEYQSAAEAYQLAHCWREALSSACLMGHEPHVLRQFASTTAESLVELKDYHAAATVHQDYLSDVEGAARLFCRGYFFADAIRLLASCGGNLGKSASSALADIIDAGLTESMGTTTELLAECKAQLGAQVPRLRELRVKKAEEPLAFYEGDDTSAGAAGGVADIPDNVSLAPTDASTMGGGSLFTRYTGKTGTVGTGATRRTAKNRRREERKRARGKKGSVYEEEYLVNSIGRLIERVNSVGEEVERLVMGLMRRGMRERARAVQAAMKEVAHMCSGCVDEVFQVEQPVVQPGSGGMAGRLSGPDNDLADEFEEPPSPKRMPPVVRQFEGLALLSGKSMV